MCEQAKINKKKIWTNEKRPRCLLLDAHKFTTDTKIRFINFDLCEWIDTSTTAHKKYQNAIGTPAWRLSGPSCSSSRLLGINDKCVKKTLSAFDVCDMHSIAYENECVRKKKKRQYRPNDCQEIERRRRPSSSRKIDN